MTSDAALADPETAALDRAVDELAAAADQWRELSLVAKRDLLREVCRRVVRFEVRLEALEAQAGGNWKAPPAPELDDAAPVARKKAKP